MPRFPAGGAREGRSAPHLTRTPLRPKSSHKVRRSFAHRIGKVIHARDKWERSGLRGAECAFGCSAFEIDHTGTAQLALYTSTLVDNPFRVLVAYYSHSR